MLLLSKVLPILISGSEEADEVKIISCAWFQKNQKASDQKSNPVSDYLLIHPLGERSFGNFLFAETTKYLSTLCWRELI